MLLDGAGTQIVERDDGFIDAFPATYLRV